MTQNPDAQKKSLGHIENSSQESFRHCFYSQLEKQGCEQPCRDDVVSIDDVLGQPVYNTLTIVNQLRLAVELTSAVLKFNSTPWLNDIWSLRDLAFVREGEDLVASLQTLHFTVELMHCSSNQLDSPMDDRSPIDLTSLMEEARCKYGVRNMMLYSLGVALLAIGRWERIDPNNVVGVRQLASQPCYLGPRYRDLTEKVLECNFGYGNDLKKAKLQEAPIQGRCSRAGVDGRPARYIYLSR